MSIYDELVQLLAPEFHLDPETVEGDRDLTEYGLDSLALVDVLFVVEDHFGIDLPSDGARFRTLLGLSRYIEQRLLPQAA